MRGKTSSSSGSGLPNRSKLAGLLMRLTLASGLGLICTWVVRADPGSGCVGYGGHQGWDPFYDCGLHLGGENTCVNQDQYGTWWTWCCTPAVCCCGYVTVDSFGVVHAACGPSFCPPS